MSEIKYLNIKEFRESGYLQELNRRFLHPLGLALEIKMDENGETLGGIWDYRDDDEGIHYDISNSDDDRKERFKNNKEFIDNEFKKRSSVRKNNIGSIIEEIPNSPEVYDEKFLSLAANFENYKKRVGKEKQELTNDVKIKMLISILDIDNDISIAIKMTKNQEAREGLELITKKIDKFLKSHEIESIQTDFYDKDIHEVINIIQSDKDGIFDVVSKGYTLNGNPFRYPKIILSKK